MKTLLGISLALSLMVTTALARLNETEQQCEARYGKGTDSKPTTPGSDKTVVYWKNRLRVACEFLKGQCQQITYSGDITKEVADALMKANTGSSSSWVLSKEGSDRDYVRGNGSATAVVCANCSVAVFTTVEWKKAHDQAVQDAKTAEESKKQRAAQGAGKGF